MTQRIGRRSNDTYGSFVVARVGQGVIVVLLTYVLTFVVLSILPGDPIINSLTSPENTYSQEEIDTLVAYYGLDRPYWVQLWDALTRLVFHGDLGLSLSSGTPVTDSIRTALPSTLLLASVATIFAIVIALAVALVANFTRFTALRTIVASIPPASQAVPVFLVCLVVIQVFAFQLGWFQVIRSEGVLPLLFAAFALSIPASAPLAQILTASITEVNVSGFVAVARSKGQSNIDIFFRQTLRPVAIPVLTVVGVTVGELIGGSVITEAIFGRFGIGALVGRAVGQQDIPVVQGVVLICAIAIVAINVLVEVTYPLLDPRLRIRKVGVSA